MCSACSGDYEYDETPESESEGENVHISLSRQIAIEEYRKSQGNWIPACGGTETEFKTRSGFRLLYVYQPSTGNHAYLNLDTDMILYDSEHRRSPACSGSYRIVPTYHCIPAVLRYTLNMEAMQMSKNKWTEATSSMELLSDAITMFRQGRCNVLTVIRMAHLVTTRTAVHSNGVGITPVLDAANELASDYRKSLDIFYGQAKES
jgi:hypothetical protein